ncbi:hypothetical protein ADIWIN_3087 [Winogradskyella psychrotolerans RS-3]|uniref:Uncharacterized protein n=1 Tax=Winogradskyella psychrotolerans RS-3 TaxID=641526 RepID=S7WYM0_9FLAO|nr:hypothetical protein ADIWIN_3087 [Winogradskyella psychrotolerans RS-3]
MSVCDANILANKTDVGNENANTYSPVNVPKIIGIRNVNKPNTKLFLLFFLKSARSISKPARNIIYNSPAVPERIILLSLSIRFIPFGPMTAPAIISPRRWGIFILFRIIGANRIITNINKNFNTGFVSGKDVSKMFSTIITCRFE